MPAHYDDSSFSYPDYWKDRDYEHQSETNAINQLLSGQKFSSIADIGGGYGRHIPTLSKYSRKVILIEPSAKQRSYAKKYLSEKITVLPGRADQTRMQDKSLDLVVLVRVLHHLPYPSDSFLEIYRILKPNGVFLFEFANSLNFKSRINSLLTGHPILPVPIDRRSIFNIKRKTIPFVNHHPQTLLKILKQSGFQPIKFYSASNFRYSFIKNIFPTSLLINLENKLNSLLSKIFFGPSIFVYAIKK